MSNDEREREVRFYSFDIRRKETRGRGYIYMEEKGLIWGKSMLVFLNSLMGSLVLNAGFEKLSLFIYQNQVGCFSP